MKKKFNIITSMLSLSATFLLLALVMFSWYVSNTEVRASGITASTGSNKLYVSTTYSENYNTYQAIEGNNYQSNFTNLDEAYWNTSATISNGNKLLLPSSSPNGQTFYYTNDVNENGRAFTTDGLYNFVDVSSVGSYYYLERSIYICNAESTNLNCVLRKVLISQGTDENSNLYKSARVYIESSENNHEIFKYYNSAENTAGDALPANSATTIMDNDPAIRSGSVADQIMRFSVPGTTTETVNEEEVKTYTAVELKLKIWIEGQNENAVAGYAGTGFKIDLLFVTV